MAPNTPSPPEQQSTSQHKMDELRDHFLDEVWALFIYELANTGQNVMTIHFSTPRVNGTDSTKYIVSTASHNQLKYSPNNLFLQLVILMKKTTYEWQWNLARQQIGKKATPDHNNLVRYHELISEQETEIKTPADHILVKLTNILKIVFALVTLAKNDAVLQHPKTASLLRELLETENSETMLKNKMKPYFKRGRIEVHTDEDGREYLALATGVPKLINQQTRNAALEQLGAPSVVADTPQGHIEQLWQQILSLHAQHSMSPAT